MNKLTRENPSMNGCSFSKIGGRAAYGLPFTKLRKLKPLQNFDLVHYFKNDYLHIEKDNLLFVISLLLVLRIQAIFFINVIRRSSSVRQLYAKYTFSYVS